MVRTPSTMLPLGTTAPEFALPDYREAPGGDIASLEDFAGAPALLVAFICNHCPFVQHVAGELMSFWSQLGLVFGKFPFVGWSRGWYAEDTENNVPDSAGSEAFKRDIMRTVSGAIEMSRLVKKGRYDERVLESKFKTMQDNITP